MTADNLIGKKLGDYILRRKLATGGMSHIYIGEDEKLARKAAVKVLTPDMQRGDTVLSARFEREARAIAALEHDSIIPIYQFGKYEDMYFLAMRYIEGRDLADEIQRVRAHGQLLEVNRAFYILDQVAAALDYAHQHNIIHRDVKPSNVLLGPNDKAYLSDFGLVLWQKVDKTLGTAFGTPRYISPEQATDSTAAVPQSDIYSLAVMVYEILTGAQLFEGPHPIEVALAHVTQTPTPPRAHNPAIPVAAQDVLLKALSKDPVDRYQTASAFLEALKEAYSQAAVAPTPVMEGEVAPESSPAILQEWGGKPSTTAPAVPAKPPQPEVSIPAPRLTVPEQIIRPEAKPVEKRRSPVPYIGGLVVLLVAGAVALGVLSSGNTPAVTPTSGQPVMPTSDEPTDTSAAVVTDTPAEIAPSFTPTAAEPTPVPSVGGQVALTLRYDETVLVLINASDKTVVLNALVLKSLTGGADDAFGSDSTLNQPLPPGGCLVIKSGRAGVTVPADWGCSASRETTLNKAQLFWLANDQNDTRFNIQDGETVLATCDTVGRALAANPGLGLCIFPWSTVADG